jgi:hypothetical protein
MMITKREETKGFLFNQRIGRLKQNLKKPVWKRAMLALCAIALVLGWNLKQRFIGSIPLQFGLQPDTPAELAQWPWPEAVKTVTRPGVTHWQSRQHDGTVVELLRFDFAANSQLRFELFDQDAVDEKPWDNYVRYNARGVGRATAELNEQFAPHGRVVAAWNGIFFGYHDGPTNPYGRAFHVAPVVIDGKVHHWGSNHRWSFGVKYNAGKPTFRVLFLPDAAAMQRAFDYGGGSVQCLLRDGKTLRLQPFPRAGDKPLPQPVKSAVAEAGHIPIFDHMRTCRASLGWSKDSRQLFVLFVKEPDNETGSIMALQYGLPIGGGWTVADVQRFWLSMQKTAGVWNAINSDAGNVLQYTLLRPDGKYDLVPARGAWTTYERRTFEPDFKGAPGGGALMYFYVRE